MNFSYEFCCIFVQESKEDLSSSRAFAIAFDEHSKLSPIDYERGLFKHYVTREGFFLDIFVQKGHFRVRGELV